VLSCVCVCVCGMCVLCVSVWCGVCVCVCVDVCGVCVYVWYCVSLGGLSFQALPLEHCDTYRSARWLPVVARVS